VTNTRRFIKALGSAHVSALKARSDIEALSGKLRGIVQKVDTIRLGPDDRRRLAEELSRLADQAQWFADGISNRETKSAAE
jgi:hypothetical protein